MSKIYVDEIAGIASADTVAIPGHVIQVVEASISVDETTSSQSYVNSSLTASITPSSSSSKILALANISVIPSNNGSNTTFRRLNVGLFLGDVTGTILKATRFGRKLTSASTADAPTYQNGTMVYLHSPGSTSTQTYTIGLKAIDSSALHTLVGGWDGTSASNITLMEIAG